MRLHNKIVVITGGATGLKTKLMGFGGTTAHLFAKEGAKVIITDINEDLGIQTAEEIKKNGGDASFMYLDVTDEKGWIDLVSNIKKKYSTIDILVHSAGFTKRTTIHETTVESWDAHMDIHAKGAFLGIKHVSPIMQNNKKGSNRRAQNRSGCCTYAYYTVDVWVYINSRQDCGNYKLKNRTA